MQPSYVSRTFVTFTEAGSSVNHLPCFLMYCDHLSSGYLVAVIRSPVVTNMPAGRTPMESRLKFLSSFLAHLINVDLPALFH